MIGKLFNEKDCPSKVIRVVQVEKIIHYVHVGGSDNHFKITEKYFNETFIESEEKFSMTIAQIEELGNILTLSSSPDDYKLKRDAFLLKISNANQP